MEEFEPEIELRTENERPKSPRAKHKKFSRANFRSNEQFLAALKKKKECNRKAQAIVEKMLESTLTTADFLDSLKDISQSHYADVVEERSILKICAYPLCQDHLKSIPDKQYQISTKSNKVYDITERKKFCSNSCFRASQYIMEQLLTSPLWLRDRDQEIIPGFKLLDIRK